LQLGHIYAPPFGRNDHYKMEKHLNHKYPGPRLSQGQGFEWRWGHSQVMSACCMHSDQAKQKKVTWILMVETGLTMDP